MPPMLEGAVIIPTSPDAMRKLLRGHDERIQKLERGGGTSGDASFAERIRLGNIYLQVVDGGGGVVELQAQKVSGGPIITIATL